MAKRPLNRDSADRGYGLLEVLVSLLFLTVAVLSIVQSIAVAASAYSLSQRQWLEAVDRWNQAVQLRAQPPPEGHEVILAPGVPALRRCLLPAEDAARAWEVFIARH
jgi:Tfp pilus assembly protein PilV